MTQKIRLSLISAVSIAALGFLGWNLYQHLQPQSKISQEKPELIDTRIIDDSNSTGGVIQPDNPEEPKPSAPIPQPNIKPITEKYAQAPKQQEIAQTVKQEITYRALQSSNDPLTSQSWYFTPLKINQAWDRSTGTNDVVVAVIDTGFALEHEDLKNQWFINPNEIGMTVSSDNCWSGTPMNKSSNNCDDDQNGYIDDYRGWNFYNVTNFPQTGLSNPIGKAAPHGTSVAGLTGAESNNGLGIASINWRTKLMPLQALSDDGFGSTSSIAAAIYYAVDNGAQIINMSLGSPYSDVYLQQAVNYAYSKGVLVVAASGNCGTGLEEGCDSNAAGAITYPALYDHVVSVGAIMSDQNVASFSGYVSGVDVVAPGYGNIVAPIWTSTNGTNAYSQNLYGTSFAAPIVSSLAALIKSENINASVEDLTEIINASSQKLVTMTNQIYTEKHGHGLIDADLAINVTQSIKTSPSTPELFQTGNNYNEHSFTAGQTMYSGCQTTNAGFCTVWFRNQATGQDRYLPYQATAANTKVGWSWSSDLLTIGGGTSWSVRASQGPNRSTTPYELNSQK